MRAWPAALLLAACSSEPEPTPSPTPSPAATQPAAAAPAIDDRPQPRPKPGGIAAAVLPAPELEGPPAAGSWTLKASATGAAALFGTVSEPTFAIRCDPAARTIRFARAVPAGGQIRIVTETGSASFAATPERAAPPAIVAEAPAQYTFLTQPLASARAGFAVQVDGGAPLRLPWDTVVERVIRGCQPG